MTARTAEDRRVHAIAVATQKRREELAPLRLEVAEAIDVVGWRRAKPVIKGVLGTVPVTGLHGGWWSKVGKRSGAAILEGLAGLSSSGGPTQPSLFDGEQGQIV